MTGEPFHVKHQQWVHKAVWKLSWVIMGNLYQLMMCEQMCEQPVATISEPGVWLSWAGQVVEQQAPGANTLFGCKQSCSCRCCPSMDY